MNNPPPLGPRMSVPRCHDAGMPSVHLFFFFRCFWELSSRFAKKASTACRTIFERSSSLEGSASTSCWMAASWSSRSRTLTACFAILRAAKFTESRGQIFINGLADKAAPFAASLIYFHQQIELIDLVLRDAQPRLFTRRFPCCVRLHMHHIVTQSATHARKIIRAPRRNVIDTRTTTHHNAPHPPISL